MPAVTDPLPPTDLAEPAIAQAAREVFGDRLDGAVRFAELLAGAGVDRGLIGPREVGRLWARHLLNCAALATLVPADARAVDVGSGAGLPGVVLALARPDVQVDLVEPMLRRTTFLHEVVAELGLTDGVTVHRGRAEESAIRAAVGSAELVTARAVAPLDRLMTWCLPLLVTGGELLALKGANATAEVAAHRQLADRLGGSEPEVLTVDTGIPDQQAHIVRVQRRPREPHQRSKRRGV